jgi:protein required for attachment to host cells
MPMSKQKIWIVVADATRARILEVNDKGVGIEPALERVPIGSNLPSREIASDRPGRTLDRAGEGRHAKAPPTDPARHAKAEFAQALAELLDGERKKDSFGRLVIVAPPQFLGDLRAKVSDPLRELVEAEIDKVISKWPTDDVWPYIQDALER